MNDSAPLPLFLVCEDGDEYIQRFQRFLSHEFRFLRVTNAHDAQAALASEPFAGLLLDLDFRRSPVSQLVSDGSCSAPVTSEEQSRWSAMQGILILQHLRRHDVGVPTFLFADLDDGDQVAFLERSLAPLTIVGSREGLAQLAARLRHVVGAATGTADSGT